MKGTKLLSLDISVIEELRKLGNASGMINSLLREYFNEHGVLKKEELENKLEFKKKTARELSKEINLIQSRIQELNTYEARIKDVFKDIPSEILNDLKNFPRMTENVLKGRFDEIYKVQYKIKYEEVLKAFKEFHKEVTR